MKRILALILCAVLVLSFTACSQKSSSTDNTQNAETTENTSAQTTEQTTVKTEATATTLKDGDYDLSFTERDCDYSYDETACKITFSDTSVKADNSSAITVNGTDVTIKSEGTYILSGGCNNGSITVEADDNAKLQLVFDGLDLTSTHSPLVIKSGDKVFITLAKGSESSLSDGSSYSLTVDDSTVDGTIFSKSDITINGSGSLSINGNYKHGIVSKDDLAIVGATVNVNSTSTGIDGKDCVKLKDAYITVTAGSDAIRSTNTEETDTRGFVYISGGSYNLTSENDAIQSASMLRFDSGAFDITSGGGSENAKAHYNEPMGRGMQMFTSSSDTEDSESSKALKAALSIKINGGEFCLNSSDDALHSNGDISISNGTFKVSSGDDGLHADNSLTIDGGTIDITKSYEGVEGGQITVNGGKIALVSSDDGFNVAGGNDEIVRQDPFSADSSKMLTINGGYIFVNASGDGLDSNGSLTVTGGTVLVSGPENSGNGALDYNGSSKITGGTLIALGSSGMAQSITGEGQCSILTNIKTQSGNTSFALCDNSGNVIASFTPPKEYSNVVVSAPAIKIRESYSIVCGATVSGADENGFAQNTSANSGTKVTEITMNDENYGTGNSFGGGMGHKPRM